MPLDLVCPAGSLVALKAAVDHGADAVYMGFRDNTNARAFLALPSAAGRAAAQAGERPAGAHAAGRSTARTASPP